MKYNETNENIDKIIKKFEDSNEDFDAFLKKMGFCRGKLSEYVNKIKASAPPGWKKRSEDLIKRNFPYLEFEETESDNRTELPVLIDIKNYLKV